MRLYHQHKDVYIGANVIIGPGCVLGYRDFCAPRDENKIPHIEEFKGVLYIQDNVEIQANTVIARGRELDSITVIGKNTKIASGVVISHNCEIGPNNLIASGVVIGGRVFIGETNFIGLNTTIRHRLTIGSFNLIGMGSVVVSDVGSYSILYGCPARFRKENKLFKEA